MKEDTTIEERILRFQREIKYRRLLMMLDDLFNIPEDEDEITNLNNDIDNGNI